MKKEDLLGAVAKFAKKGELSRSEVLDAWEKGKASGKEKVWYQQLTIGQIVAFVGGLVVFIGISILIAQNWDVLSMPVRILLTLGTSLGAFVAAMILNRDVRTEVLAQVFYLMHALLMPLGLFVLFHELGLDLGSEINQVAISAILLVTHLSSYVLLGNRLMLAFAIYAGTWFYFAVTNTVFAGSPLSDDFDLWLYRGLALGLSYLSLGYYFQGKRMNGFAASLYALGALAVLSATFGLGGFSPNQNLFWEAAYPGVITAFYFTSVHVKQRSFLVLATLFLMGFIFKITSEYFADSIGWPVSLVMMGMLMILVGYLGVVLNRKYLGSKR